MGQLEREVVKNGEVGCGRRHRVHTRVYTDSTIES